MVSARGAGGGRRRGRQAGQGRGCGPWRGEGTQRDEGPGPGAGVEAGWSGAQTRKGRAWDSGGKSDAGKRATKYGAAAHPVVLSQHRPPHCPVPSKVLGCWEQDPGPFFGSTQARKDAPTYHIAPSLSAIDSAIVRILDWPAMVSVWRGRITALRQDGASCARTGGARAECGRGLRAVKGRGRMRAAGGVGATGMVGIGCFHAFIHLRPHPSHCRPSLRPPLHPPLRPLAHPLAHARSPAHTALVPPSLLPQVLSPPPTSPSLLLSLSLYGSNPNVAQKVRDWVARNSREKSACERGGATVLAAPPPSSHVLRPPAPTLFRTCKHEPLPCAPGAAPPRGRKRCQAMQQKS